MGEEIRSNYFLYFLGCPESRQLKYIGFTKDPNTRYYQHLISVKEINETAKEVWIKTLLRKNLKPVMIVFCDFMNRRDALDHEIELINWGFSNGFNLLNTTFFTTKKTFSKKYCDTIRKLKGHIKEFKEADLHSDIIFNFKGLLASNKIQVILGDPELIQLFEKQAKKQARSESNLACKYIIAGLTKDEGLNELGEKK